MSTALQTEFIQRTKGEHLEFSTFYAGGGTPTLLPPEFWMRLIGMVKTPSLKEVTIETNPAVLDASGYSSLLLAGFNRISVGVQSFNNEKLKLLGRIHSAEGARDSLKLIAKTGFRNISLDLMYGLPGQTLLEQRKDIEEALSFMPRHISAYDLTLEPGTPLGKKGKKASESICAEMYYQTHDMLMQNGYTHYEVSSYALEDRYRARHNSSYWKRTPYIGIGPSAHSFTGSRRSWNFSDTQKYESAVVRGLLPEESGEDLTRENEAHEILALGFRNTDGVDMKELETHGYRFDPSSLLETGLISRKSHILIPSAEGMLFADTLALKAAELLENIPLI